MAGVGPPQQPTTQPNASLVNSFRVAAVVERLVMHVTAIPRPDPNEFSNLCLSLARGIDYAVAHNEIPYRAEDLPSILKQVYEYQRQREFHLQAEIMVLMISVKSACRSGWFITKDADDLLKLTNEIGSIFCHTENIHPEPSKSLPIISKIMARFYPRMMMGHVLASLEIKPGYGVHVTDFNIAKKTMNTQEKIHLFVAQMDNIETSSCIISPPLVNFLLNGNGVQRRNNLSMDIGPQLPTNVTSMLKYGTNLLQAIGPFNGNYIVAVVFMSVTSSSEGPVLQDYIRPLVAAHNSDSEIIEESSRISINCPISLTRIKTPVKGHLCKHHQCFDYDNFIEINLRRPSWRCPQCDQSVSYTNIRIDQFMAKILREVGGSAADVIISADGSWKLVRGGRECAESLGCQQDWSKQSESSNATANIVDLTMEEMDEEMDDTDARDTWEVEDRKPSQDILQGFSFATNTTLPLEVNDTSQVVQDAAPRMEDDIWARILSCSASFGMKSGISETPAHLSISSVPTDFVALALDRVSGVTRGSTADSNTSLCQDQLLAPNSSQCVLSHVGNSIVHSDTGNRLSHTRHITRSPVAVQALPAQTPNSREGSTTSMNSLMPNVTPPVAFQTPLSFQALPAQTVPNSQQWPSTSLNSSLSSVCPSVAFHTPLSVAPMTDCSNASARDIGRQPWFAGSSGNSRPASDTGSTLLEHHLLTQNRNYQNYEYPRIQSLSSQQIVGFPASTQNLLYQQAPNFRVPQSTAQPPSTVGSSTHFQNQQAPHLRASQPTTPPSGMIGPTTQFPRQQQAPHLRVPRSIMLPTSMVGPSTSYLQTSNRPGLQGSISHMSGNPANTLAWFHAAAHAGSQPASNMVRAPPVIPVQLLPTRTGSHLPTTTDDINRTIGGQQRGGNTGGMAQPVSRAKDLVGALSDQNRHPPGRMRGSLSGRDFSGTLSQYIIHPNQPVQLARPPPELTSQPVANSSLPMRLDNSMNTQRSQQQSFPLPGDMAASTVSFGPSGIIP